MIKKQEKAFREARENMVDSQIHPMGVTNEKLLNAFLTVPREAYVPEFQQGICYCDEDIQIAPGRYLIEASVFGRLIQATEPKESDVVLLIGSGMGYGAAILSYLVTTVVALEDDASMTEFAQAAWDKHSNANIAGITGDLREGHEKASPYDIIFINGAVGEVPESIKNQLSIGGRLVTLVKGAGQSATCAVLITRTDDHNFELQKLFEAGTPYLTGFEPKKEFVF